MKKGETGTILQRISRGDDVAAPSECIKTYGGLVWYWSRRWLRSREDAEDAMQEIFLDIWKSAHRFDGERGPEVTFVAMIAKRRIVDRIRRAKRRIVTESIEDLVVTDPRVWRTEFVQIGIEARQAANVINLLRPERREVLHLSFVAGMSHREISEKMGMPIGSVKTHLRRGLIEVRRLLSGDQTAADRLNSLTTPSSSRARPVSA